MEELSYKLKQGNPVLMIQAVSKAVEKIKIKTKELPENKWNQIEELNYLIQTSVFADNPLVALTINRGLLSMVESKLLSVPYVLSNLLASISVAKCYDGICYTIGNLLRINLEQNSDRIEFNLRSPQHPFIPIIIQEPLAWIHILGVIKEINNTVDRKYRKDFNKLMHPFFMYVICKPNSKVPTEFKYSLWKYLLNENDLDIQLVILGFLQSSTKEELQLNNNFLMELLQTNSEYLDVFILLLTASIYQSFLKETNCIEAVLYLQNILKEENSWINSCILLLLSKSLLVCPFTYLTHLLKLCQTLLNTSALNHFSVYLLKSSLLQWIAYTCPLTSDHSELIYQLLERINQLKLNNFMISNELNVDSVRDYLLSNNEHTHFAYQLSILSEKMDGSRVLCWLTHVESLSALSLIVYYDYLCSLLLNENYSAIVSVKSANLLVRIGEENPKLTTQLLTLFLYKLSNSDDPHLHSTLLKHLPKMGTLKENLPAILSVLKLLSGSTPTLQIFAMNLYLNLWKTDSNCYSYLHNSLIANKGGSDCFSKYILTKANILKEISMIKPEAHGSELVLHLSEVLNKCVDLEGATASALAIEGICYLCKAGVIDIFSTWQELSPRFINDKRPQVIRSLCKLMAEFSHFSLNAEDENKTIEEAVIRKLWIYATTEEDSQTIENAYEALGMFNIEQISLQIPDELKSQEYEMSVFSIISGSFWTDLLKKCKPIGVQALNNFISKLVALEIAEYKPKVYHVAKGQREPANFNSLPNHSVVRALGNYLKYNISDWGKESVKKTYIQCLEILSRKYAKPLPPLDWCFLQELVHFHETKLNCIRLASKQVKLSGTARRFMENYIVALASSMEQHEEIITVYENLGELCDSIQPIILKPFLENTLTTFLQKASESGKTEDSPFYTIIDCLADILSREKLHDANLHIIEEVLVQIINLAETGTLVFDKVLTCVHVLPKKLIESLSENVKTEDGFRKLVQIRYAVALKVQNNHLMWFNDVIGRACLFPTEQQYFLNRFSSLLRNFTNSNESPTWILNFLGRIQVSIINEFDFDKQLDFYCKIFLISVIFLSTQDIFVLSEDTIGQFDQMLHLFPQSIVFLLRNPIWKTYDSQVVEWLHYMVNYEHTPLVYKRTFFKSIMALKNDSVMQEGPKWLKYAIFDTSFIS